MAIFVENNHAADVKIVKSVTHLSLYIAFLLCNALQSAVLASIKCECLSSLVMCQKVETYH